MLIGLTVSNDDTLDTLRSHTFCVLTTAESRSKIFPTQFKPEVAPGAVGSKAEVLLLLIDYLLLLPLCCGGVWSLFCCVVPTAISSFAIISLGKREPVALNLLPCVVIFVLCAPSSRCNGLV